MYAKIKELADEALRLQNKDRMDSALHEISLICLERMRECSMVPAAVLHSYDGADRTVYGDMGNASPVPNPIVFDGAPGDVVRISGSHNTENGETKVHSVKVKKPKAAKGGAK